ncbi:hypothetical protein OG402_33950 [Streptomyces anulatus]|uniref:hypothetical protein n=1 Tax=Streptomyces anulatus TaxID=1892 RepID=UPI002257E241|nr:hypothetical protein [Streptomyces anulatus]MCX4605473.1 hypothetical protein [Streptomyces anulatus]
MQLPEQPVAGQPDPTIHDNANRILAAIRDIEQATYHRDDTKLPAVGDMPPVEQPGRPSMSPKAVERNVTILTSSFLTLAAGGAVSAVLWSSGHANETVIAWICGGVVAVPVALTLPVLALKGLMKNAREVAEAAPAPVTNHFHGNVHHDERTVTSTTRGVIANTRNQLPH